MCKLSAGKEGGSKDTSLFCTVTVLKGVSAFAQSVA